MKLLLLSLFSILSAQLFAQETSNPPLKATPSNGITKTYKIKPQPRVKLVKINTVNTSTPTKTVASLTSYIDAVQTKIDYIKSDQSQLEEAEQSGWFTEMYKNIEQAKAERQLLIDKNIQND